MTIQFHDLADLKANKIGSRSGIYRKIEQGTFPKPVKDGRNSKWPAYEVERVQRAMIAGASEEDLKKLVEDIHKDRGIEFGGA